MGSPLKTLIVTSQVTYVPENYRGFLAALLKRAGDHISAVAFIDNMERKQFAVPLKFLLCGARGVAGTVFGNLVSALKGESDKLVRGAGIAALHFSSVNSPGMIAWVKQNKIDLIVNARTREIYRRPILNAAPLGAINVHHGLLPGERGVMCDLFALAEGAAAGFSVHVMNEKIDDGPILQKSVVSPPGSKDYLGHLLRGSQLEGEAVGRLLQEVAKNSILPLGEPNVPGPGGAIYRKFKPTRSLVLQLKTQGVRL